MLVLVLVLVFFSPFAGFCEMFTAFWLLDTTGFPIICRSAETVGAAAKVNCEKFSALGRAYVAPSDDNSKDFNSEKSRSQRVLSNSAAADPLKCFLEDFPKLFCFSFRILRQDVLSSCTQIQRASIFVFRLKRS